MNGKMIRDSMHPPGVQVFTIMLAGGILMSVWVWVYLTTGSVTQFSLILLSTAVPAIVMSPVTGALVDRWDRRKAMILSDSGAAFCTLAIAVLLTMNSLEIWHIYIIIAISSASSMQSTPSTMKSKPIPRPGPTPMIFPILSASAPLTAIKGSKTLSAKGPAPI